MYYTVLLLFFINHYYLVSEHVQLWVFGYFDLNHVIMMYGWSLLCADAT